MSNLKDLPGIDSSQIDFGSKDKQEISLPFIVIPGEILFNPYISPTQKILFGFIRSLSKTQRGCWATNEYLGRLIGCNKTTVSSLLSGLKKYGYIEFKQTQKKDQSSERHIYETSEYHEIYKSLVIAFHVHVSTSEVIAALEDEVEKICCPGNQENFDKDKGLWSEFRDELSAEERQGDFEKSKGVLDKIKRGILRNQNPYLDSYTYKNNDIGIESKDSINDSGESPSKTQNRFQRTSPAQCLLKKEKSPIVYIEPGTGEYAVVSTWNKLLPPASQHTDLGTKTILQVKRYLVEMKNGVFGDISRRLWDGKWIDRHKINVKAFAEKKWTFREICRTIEGPLGDMYKEGFWPPDKLSLPRSLAGAFYNLHTHSSFFVMAYYDPPGPLKGQPMKDPHKGITEDLISVWHAIDPRMSQGDWRQYSQGVKGLEKYLEEIDWSNYGARQMFPGGQKGNPYTLVMEYVKWMEGQNPDLLAPSKVVERLNWSMIRPDFWMWQKFMEAVNRYWGQVFLCIPAEEK
ncbi:MAG: helix-turn-helix domain-containing protein [Desulfobacterales bacterium]|nr:helix-turn-helix domain-containing protein [Desulfobacterales bacterium]